MTLTGQAPAPIVVTASNPWVDNGFKVTAPSGAAAGPDVLGPIEARLAQVRGS